MQQGTDYDVVLVAVPRDRENQLREWLNTRPEGIVASRGAAGTKVLEDLLQLKEQIGDDELITYALFKETLRVIGQPMGSYRTFRRLGDFLNGTKQGGRQTFSLSQLMELVGKEPAPGLLRRIGIGQTGFARLRLVRDFLLQAQRLQIETSQSS